MDNCIAFCRAFDPLIRLSKIPWVGAGAVGADFIRPFRAPAERDECMPILNQSAKDCATDRSRTAREENLH